MRHLLRALGCSIALAVAAIPPHAPADSATSGGDRVFVIPLAGTNDGNDVRGTLCTHEDWVAFSATSQTNGKLVSICLAEGDDSTPSHLTYRFGKPDEVEMIYPAEAKGWQDAFMLRIYTRARTTYLKFHFQKDGFDYSILEGDDDGDYGLWLRVMRLSDEKVLSEFPLVAATERFSLMQLSDHVRNEPFDE